MTRESSPKVAFITARLDEAEAQYRDHAQVDDPTAQHYALHECGDYNEGYIVSEALQRLREIAGMRKLLDAHLGYYGADDDEYLPVSTLSILAAIWDDHEDYPALVGTVTS